MMMKLLALLVLAVTLSSAVAAEEMPLGVEFYDAELREITWVDRLFGGDALAIVTGQPTYAPGATADVTIQTPVPCTAMYAYYGLNMPDGKGQPYVLTTSITRCTTAVFRGSLKVPDTPGTYEIYVEFKDGNFQRVGYETAALVVRAPGSTACPTGYCSAWTSFQKVDGGRIETKTCYHYASGTCAQSAAVTYRTVCDSGFALQNGRCVARTTVPVCGDGTVQSGEACDRGQENGFCPSSCSSLCAVNVCGTLISNPTTPAAPAEPAESSSAAWWLVGAGAALVAGGLVLGGRRR